MLSTRAQILDAARRLFAQQGYQQTSIREIAEQLGLTKTAVLYHFPAKADIFTALAEPFLVDFKAALDRAETREEIVVNTLDVWLKHRNLLRDNVMHNMAVLSQESVIRRFTELMFEANRRVAGPGADLPERIRAAQVIAMLSDPVITHADEPVERVREEVLRGARLLYPDLP
jgi:AcrR family transcriptional regulator